jgi:predicted GIY-YIG superfamily endonuclease
VHTEERIVYILRSLTDPERHYVGITSGLRRRLAWHNRASSGYTTRHRPWSVVVALYFPSQSAALRFERYLKSGSGRAFSKRHFAGVNGETWSTRAALR